jgi:hypothetical protein
MNNLRDKLLKAGLITEEQKKITEFELEIKRIYTLLEGKREGFRKNEAAEFARAMAHVALSRNVEFGVLLDFVNKEICLRKASR